MAGIQDQNLQDQQDHAAGGVGSIRSRSSSVISTGTKFSILTMPQSDTASQHNIDGVISGSTTAEGASMAAPRLVPRPMSLYSFRSTGEALPAYSEVQQPEEQLPYSSPDGDDNDDRSPEETGAEEQDLPPTTPTSITDPENTLTMHYGRVVRTIDENHARLLARTQTAHEAQLASLRNEIDGEYRKVLKMRGQEVERIREEAAAEVERISERAAARETELESQISALKDQVRQVREEGMAEIVRIREEHAGEVGALEASVEARCAKARHLVEELWEERWFKRNELSAEEGKRSEREWRETVRILVEDNEAKWVTAVGEVVPESLAAIRKVIERNEKEAN